ncbi:MULTISPECIES: Fe(3+) ABC transporter substrate-binding protein [Okeania]|uniref:Fe(3+) ABC transporter substrate-binding protein n=1 Tax=Okeania hirsuta TaxID=1458930 RepID=A0A3N6RGI0_9CYAN|nr:MULTISPECIES: Fe(3+) ABC transporter substrate-binding protein [Okeania]NES77827.1 Fe(3+) ABC transporter substrate-binding protein [Okeania sp. SIO1H4]NES88812.1 Fe(3+) ABC transporter substrate-binding protein [Okeania sp. SIO2B9]NET22656.1 Fe(3+) ABC transporter substrate-binding protein [Okeania sp. SIO1H5]NET79304.1 Fe(3+) ABC transporter substrate-binding protein [Okeania sp. SIO1F9]NET95308.1 Fe(3+) ABC transporter substrate-binding protein [Okeania sp. SIO1H2]
MKITRRIFLATGTAMASVAIAELGKSNRGLAQSRAINLYSSRHYDTDQALYDSFTKKTGLKVNLIEGKGDELIERIKSEGANSPADVFITVDAGRLGRAEEAGILQPISSSTLNSKIPANLRSPQNLWFGFSKRARVIVYNKDKVKPSELSTYEDLATDKWKGKILIRSSNNIYNQSLIASLIEIHGISDTENWAKDFVSNFARPPEGNDTAQIKGVAAGIGNIGIANSYYVGRLAKSDKAEDKAVVQKIGMFFPNQNGRGTHINISGGGVVKTAPNKEGAIKFLEHLASPEAQKIFSEGNNEYPVVAGVPVPSVLTTYGNFKSDSINVATYGKLNAEAIKLMDRVGWK